MIFKISKGMLAFLLSTLMLACSFAGILFVLDRPAAAEEEGVRVPILMYHETNTKRLSEMGITPWELESDLKYLQTQGYTAVTMTELIAYVHGGKPLPPKPVVLTFDDGFYNNYVYAYPLMEKYDMKMVLSVIGKSVEQFSRDKDENIYYSYVNWEQINEMTASGRVEIQNHTYDLHRITARRRGCKKNEYESLSEYENLLGDDVNKCQLLILRNAGSLPNTFTYPFGLWCADSEDFLKKMGFQASLRCYSGINILTRDPDCLYCLKRLSRTQKQSAQVLLEKAEREKK